MADYELSILRNTVPVESKETAISILDTFDNHIIGQPISLLYYNDKNDLKVLFAVGKKNSFDIQPGYNNFGRDFYDIIGEVDGKVLWKQIQGNVIVDTQDQLQIVDTTQEELDTYKDLNLNIDNNVLTFVENRIYKGENLISSLLLEDISLYNDIEIDGITYNGNIIDIIKKLHKNFGVVWNNTSNKVYFEKCNNLDFYSKTPDENTIYEVSTNVSTNLTQHNLYIGTNLIGDNYNSKIYELSKEMPNNVGGISKGTTLEQLLNKGSLSSIIDEMLFNPSETNILEYWEDIDAVLEATNKNLL